jgi:hypothetical protein
MVSACMVALGALFSTAWILDAIFNPAAIGAYYLL